VDAPQLNGHGDVNGLGFSRADQALLAHNEGHQSKARTPTHSTPSATSPAPPIFSAQSYLRYQGAKFVARFDANCYIHITRKMDTHDLARERLHFLTSTSTSASTPTSGNAHDDNTATILSILPARALVISIETDGLFTPSEQYHLAAYIRDASLVVVPSPDGHDGFLLEFERINEHVLAFLMREFPEYYETEAGGEGEVDFKVKKTSLFGEAEADVTRW